MKGAEFSVQSIRSSGEGNQTPPTDGNHAVLDTMVARLLLAGSDHNILTLGVGTR